jgi:RAD51-like protein 3
MLSGWNGLAQGCDGEQALPPHGPSRVLLSSIVDALLGGGLRQGQLTEITGQSSSGKTQVCLCSASHVAARQLGVVMYLDTSNSFSPSRIARIVDGFPISLVREPKNVRLERVMSSIICKSVFDIFDLFEVLHQLELSLKSKVSVK